MRKSLAFFFLFIFLLNIAGYYLVMEGWQWHNSITWSQDDERNANHELIIRVPLNVPYFTQEKDWEKTDGQFDYKGEVYRIVRQKITLDAIFIACIKDSESNLIKQQLKDFAKTFTDRPEDAKQSVKAFPGFIKDYVSHLVSIKNMVTGWSMPLGYIRPSPSFVSSFLSSIVHPPERTA